MSRAGKDWGECQINHELRIPVNFNGGDRYFYPGGIDYTGHIDNDWAAFLSGLIMEHRYDKIVLFGDTRPMHIIAADVARRHGVKVVVFEEGYLRPHFVTCEVGGVNGFSSLPRSSDFYKSLPLTEVARDSVPQDFKPSRAAWYYAWKYGFEQKKHRKDFPHYTHVRELSWTEGFRWVGWTLRKKVLKSFSDKNKLDAFLSASGRKFLIPLQVGNDSQVIHHSPFKSVGPFVAHAIGAFAANAPPDAKLLIKHHPLDPHNNYDSLIGDLARQYGCRDRVWYVVEGNLPGILSRVEGVLTINSTVGLSALHHGVPTCVMGESVYEMPGLATRDVAGFFSDPSKYVPDRDLFVRFKAYLLTHNQAVGSFYKPVPASQGIAGVLWPEAVKINPIFQKSKNVARSDRPVSALRALGASGGGCP